MKKRAAFLLAAGLMVISLTACGSGSSTSTEGASTAKTLDSREKVLNFGCQMYDDGSVSTVSGESSGWNCMRYGISEGLFKFNDAMEVEPWLAESYTVNEAHTAFFENRCQVVGGVA